MPDRMTLGDAVELLDGDGWACACTGPGPGTGSLCWCQWTIARAKRLRRAAHIAVRQLSDLADRRRLNEGERSHG